MRQIYHRQNNKRRKSRYGTILVIIIFVVIVELSFGPIRSLGKGMGSVLSSPIDSLSNGITSIFKVVTGNSGKLLDENRELKSEILRLEKEISSRDLLRVENESLRQICKIDQDEGMEYIVSEVIARPPKIPYDTIRINKGYTDNIIEGKKVFSNNYYIGIVDTTDSLQSTVSLIGNNGEIPVIIGDSEGLIKPLKGLSYVGEFSSTSEINIGDTVVLSDDRDNPFAQVTHIEKDNNEPSITVYINIPISLSSMRYVSVEK